MQKSFVQICQVNFFFFQFNRNAKENNSCKFDGACGLCAKHEKSGQILDYLADTVDGNFSILYYLLFIFYIEYMNCERKQGFSQ